MKYIVKGHRYRIWDYILIPFRAAPVASSLKCINVIATALISLANALSTTLLVDTAIAIHAGTQPRSALVLPLVYILAILAYNILSQSINKFIDLRITQRVSHEYRMEVLEKRAKLAYQHVENNDTWDLIQRVCKEPEKRISESFANLLSAAAIVVQLLSLLILVTSQLWWAGIAVIVIAVPLMKLAKKVGEEVYNAYTEVEKRFRRANYLKSVLSSRESAEERTLFGYTDRVHGQWHAVYSEAVDLQIHMDKVRMTKMKIASCITACISLSIIVLLIFPYSGGQLSAGMFIALVNAVLGIVQMMSWQLANVVGDLAKNRKYLDDLNTFASLDETDGALEIPADAETLAFKKIEFRGVTFRYPGTQRDILKDLTLTLDSGRHYAIVGVNGAGKTTLTKLLTGLYDNYTGEILIDGRELRSFSQAQLKAMFGVVYQDFARYSETLSDNIALGDYPNRDDERIRACASFIGLDETVSELPQGYDSYLGKIHEGGVDLSGGQWQRVAIARVLYNRALLRILDEPTAALDPVAESNVYELFGRISRGHSTLFITHRLGAAKLADDIIVLSDGHVAEEGDHNTLLSYGGIYAGMYEAQRSWYA